MQAINLNRLFHRSRERIRELGEVFTPDKYVEDMLDLLSKGEKKFWANESYMFFEPCCGHGNIVLAIYRRRLRAIYKKAVAQGISKPYLYAVANALNTLWAIDIDAKNVESCRMRVLALTLEFIEEKTDCKDRLKLVSQHKNFFAHVLATIKWQIHENETLSALSANGEAKDQAYKTKVGGAWFKKNGHHQLFLNKTWVAFFSECKRKKVVSIEFRKSEQFIAALCKGQAHRHISFAFAKKLFKPVPLIITQQERL